MDTEHPTTLEFWRGRLPHWEVVDGLYFVTLHLAGAIPDSAARELRARFQSMKASGPHRTNILLHKVFMDMECWLDHSKGATHLAHPEVAHLVMDAIEHRSFNRSWNTHIYVVMPSHIHLLFEVLTGSMHASLESFKQWTSRRAKRILKLEKCRFWQKEWFDHWVRSSEEAEAIMEYIRQNPVKAGLVDHWEDYPYGSWSRRR